MRTSINKSNLTHVWTQLIFLLVNAKSTYSLFPPQRFLLVNGIPYCRQWQCLFNIFWHDAKERLWFETKQKAHTKKTKQISKWDFNGSPFENDADLDVMHNTIRIMKMEIFVKDSQLRLHLFVFSYFKQCYALDRFSRLFFTDLFSSRKERREMNV